MKYCVTAWRWRSRPKPSKPASGDQPAPKPSKFDKKDYTFNLEIVLNDRRPSDELQDYELRRRLEVYRQYDRDERYGADQRAYWREVRQRDEALLQRRLIRERRQRQAELASRYEDDQYDIELGEGYDPDQQDDVYAAEVDDEELEDVLVSAPRRKIDRRYTVEEVEASPDLREALPRIEIDTVRFGFNEAFVRPEEVGNLDRIGEVMERVLSKHPRESVPDRGPYRCGGFRCQQLDAVAPARRGDQEGADDLLRHFSRKPANRGLWRTLPEDPHRRGGTGKPPGFREPCHLRIRRA